MSIVIREMEMPKTCCQCDLKIYDPEIRWDENGIEQIGAWVCKRTREIIWNTQRGESCPLLPLPEGHGRLVDASVAEGKIKEMYMTMVNSRSEGSTEVAFGLHLAASIIRTDTNVPTIVPAEGGPRGSAAPTEGGGQTMLVPTAGGGMGQKDRQ